MKSTLTIPKHVFNCMSFLFSFLILHIMYSVYKLLLTLSIFFLFIYKHIYHNV